MTDLDDLLLEAAGRTNTAGRKRHQPPPSRKQHRGSDSVDGSDSMDEDSDDDRSYANRKRSQVPLKKRFEPERDSGKESSRDDHDGEDSDESDVGPDLYKNDADRKWLGELSELEREMILTDRADKKGSKDLMEKLRSKRGNAKSTQSRKETSPLPLSRGVRSSARNADKSAAMDDALNQIRAKRLKQQDSKALPTAKDGSRESPGSQGISPIKQKVNIGSFSQSENVGLHAEDETLNADGEFFESDEESSEPPKFEDIKEITIQRSKLAKWFMEPFFEELVVGCFVRVGFGRTSSGPVYRLCMVQNVDATKPDRQYKLEGKVTHKYLNCVWGNETTASMWQMSMVSDSPPTEEEFNQWFREVERTAGRIPSKQEVIEKEEALKKSNTFVYSATTVKQMLQEKKYALSRPVNIAVEKDRLRTQLEVAESKGDEVEVKRIKTQLQELEASRQTEKKDSKAIRLAEMNRKNRFENFINASGSKPANMNLKAGEAGYDPFSRRWTRSRNYYVSRPGGGDEAPEAKDGITAEETSEEKRATEAALEAAAGAGKLVDTSAPVDKGTESYTLHNFDLPISLAALQKFGGPQGAHIGYMTRKQVIEATVGCQVRDDGKRHPYALSVNDYIRRRGIYN